MKLDPLVAQELTERVQRAKRHLYNRLLPTRALLADIYAGREPGGGSLASGFYSAYPQRVFNTNDMIWPDGTANLLFSTLDTLGSATFPATPSVRAEPDVDGFENEAEDQTDLNNFILKYANTARAMQRADFLATTNGWAGVKIIQNRKASVHKRTRLESVDALACGWEPFSRGFSWHEYIKEWALLPDAWKPSLAELGATEIHDWTKIKVTEVYLHGFAGIFQQMAVFIRVWDSSPAPEADLDAIVQASGIGTHAVAEDIKATPLIFLKYTEPPPGEDVPPAIVIQWMPVLRNITIIQKKIAKVARRLAAINLYLADAVDTGDIQKVINNPDAYEHWVQITTKGVALNDLERAGVSDKVRPVEEKDLLGPLTGALSVQLNLFEQVSGVGELQRGSIPTGRETATEIRVVQNNSQLRIARRREFVSDMLAEISNRIAVRQREIYGESVRVPLDSGKVIEIPVPSAKSRFAFTVDAVELGHLAARGDLQGIATGVQVLQNGVQTGVNADPAVREGTRRLLRALGWRDLDFLLPPPIMGLGPDQKIQEFLLRGTPITPATGENYQAFIAAFESWITRELMKPDRNEAALAAVTAALQEYKIRQQATRPPALGRQLEGAGSAINSVSNPAPAQAAAIAGRGPAIPIG